MSPFLLKRIYIGFFQMYGWKWVGPTYPIQSRPYTEYLLSTQHRKGVGTLNRKGKDSVCFSQAGLANCGSPVDFTLSIYWGHNLPQSSFKISSDRFFLLSFSLCCWDCLGFRTGINWTPTAEKGLRGPLLGGWVTEPPPVSSPAGRSKRDALEDTGQLLRSGEGPAMGDLGLLASGGQGGELRAMAPDMGSLSVWRAGWSLPAEAQHVCLVQSPFEFQPGRSCAHSSQYLTLASVQTQSEMKMALPPLLPGNPLPSCCLSCTAQGS